MFQRTSVDILGTLDRRRNYVGRSVRRNPTRAGQILNFPRSEWTVLIGWLKSTGALAHTLTFLLITDVDDAHINVE